MPWQRCGNGLKQSSPPDSSDDDEDVISNAGDAGVDPEEAGAAVITQQASCGTQVTPVRHR